MATFWKRAANSVYYIFSLYYHYFYLKLFSHVGFEGGTLVLITSVPGNC